MKKEVELLLAKSRRSIGAAEILLREGNCDFAASRAYYSMFYHEIFHDAFEDRQQADYGFLDPFPKEEAERLVHNAEKFVEEMEKFLSLP